MARSSDRTPASRVYSAAISRSASSVTVTSSAFRPALDSCLGSRWSRAMSDLLVLGVAVELDQLHPVEQRAGDRVEHVRRGQEHHVGQVELDLEVVVAERVVLRRVEHLEQRRPRGRRGSRRRSCPPRRAARPGSSSPPRGWPGRSGRAARRRRCAGGRGSPPRPGRRPGRPGRTCGPWPAPPTRRATSCRRRAGRPARARRRSAGRRRSRGRGPRGACAPPGTR